MTRQGLTSAQAEESRAKYGSNALTQLPPEPLWKKILNGFKDPMIMILLVALAVQVVLFVLGQAEWYEPAGILIAIIIANGVASVSESRQEGKASALKAEENARETSKVLRDGRLSELHVDELVVGDLIFLQAGDRIPVDGTLAEGSLKVDQSALNGESEEAEKVPLPTGGTCNNRDLLDPCYCYRGTVVCGGEAWLEAAVVGDKTLFGELALEVQEDSRATPLQVKLGKLAKQISTFGYIGACAIIAGILAKTLITGAVPQTLFEWVRLLLDAVTVAVTVIVCAVPEGLPMLTSILLSFQSIRMAKDNVLVRKINGLETAGSLNILFTDKTGTITEGRLSVEELYTADGKAFHSFRTLNPALKKEVGAGIGINNSAMLSGGVIIGGNSTDRAVMGFLHDGGAGDELNHADVLRFTAFDSNRKCSSCTIVDGGRRITYVKGAPERMLDRCSGYLDENGLVHPLTDRKAIASYMNTQSGRSMRLLAVARADSDDENDALTLICILSIRDAVRKEAAAAIREVRQAGIQVVMVTGDRRETAAAIAKEAGLLTGAQDLVLTSAELGRLSDDELKKQLPRLSVVARALPSDKSRLVRVAQELDLVVGMTGDGVNDSPALKKADVGFAMGSGTEVAKEAGDITILDDNFSSIETAILYGRTMFRSIRKFLIFQLTVNVAAVLICFLGPLFGINVVLTVVQLLLVNLAMDTLAAIAFGSEPALKEYMREKPVPRSESILSKSMLSEILVCAAYITFACLAILLVPPVRGLFASDGIIYLRSALFATFMMAIGFNGFNARTHRANPFSGLGRNRNFLLVMLSVFALQFIFVTFGGHALSVERLTPKDWLVCIIIAFLVIPIDSVRKLLASRN